MSIRSIKGNVGRQRKSWVGPHSGDGDCVCVESKGPKGRNREGVRGLSLGRINVSSSLRNRLQVKDSSIWEEAVSQGLEALG